MPEGPECKVYVNGLNEELQGREITKIDIVGGRYAKHGSPQGFQNLVESLPRKVVRVETKGKFIYFELDNEEYFWNTLGMTGSWSRTKDNDTRLIFTSRDKKIYFADMRNFGTFKFGMSKQETQKKLDSLGYDLLNCPEPLPPEISLKLFELKRNLNNTLAQVLMNQKNYAGVGNYIKAEALYRAKLSPHRTGASLSQDDIILLHNSISDVIRSSYASKKAVLVNYKDMPECGAEFKKVVYKRTHDPLGNPVIAEETKDKRTTHWVPAVQK